MSNVRAKSIEVFWSTNSESRGWGGKNEANYFLFRYFYWQSVHYFALTPKFRRKASDLEEKLGGQIVHLKMSDYPATYMYANYNIHH